MKDKQASPYSPVIHFIREQRVILDSDLARLYGVDTRSILQAIKRNKERFPPDFVFILSNQEVTILRSQIVISRSSENWGGRRGNTYAFTEHGVAMLSAVLKSERAVKVSIEIIRMFVKLRQLALSNATLEKRVENLEEQTDSHAQAIIGIIRELEKPVGVDKKKIGFEVEDAAVSYGCN